MTPARLIAAALLVVTALPLGATADPSVACPAKVSTTADGWRRVASPSGARLVAYAVMPHDPSTVLVTDGTTVQRTRDDGCTWLPLYTLPATPSAEFPFSADTADVVDVVAGKTRLYVLVNDTTGPRVLVSANGGVTWKNAAALPLSDTVAPKLVADTSGMYAYVTLRPTGLLVTGAGEVLYATEDGGATWNPRPVVDTTMGAAVTHVADLAVDPLLGTDVWASTDQGVFRSGDAGEAWTYTNIGDQAAGFGPIAVVHRADSPVLVAVASQWDTVAYVRRAGGGWTTVNTPAPATSITGGRTLTQVAITTDTGVYELDFDALTWSPMHRGSPRLSRLSTDDTASAAFYACACDTGSDAIWSRTPRTFASRNRGADRGADNPGVPGFDGCAPNKQEPDPVDFGPSSVTGKSDEITVAPGQSVKVPYTFRVQPRELDLFYLIAAGPRSAYFSCQAKQGAIWSAYRMARERNLRVGLGQYRDYLITGQLRLQLGTGCLTSTRKEFVYRRELRVGPVDNVFKDAVSGIGYGWDQCTSDSAALPALLQAATGMGQDVAPRGPSPYDIAPGQDGVFGEDAYRVILHVADAYFSTPTRTSPQYPGPEFEPVIAALQEEGIKQVGINVPYVSKKKHHGTDEPPAPPEETGEDDLRRVARETGTFASTAVDCGNRVPSRVAAGEPLVCTYIEAGRRAADGPQMGRLMLDLMNSLRDVQPMGLSVLAGDARLSQVTPNVATRLDHLRAQTLRYTVTFKCAPSEAGLVKQVRLGGAVGSTVVATTTATVRCGAPPAVRVPEVHAPPPIAHVAGTAAGPVANTNLSLNTATQPQGQMQQVMQGAAMGQEEQERQLAYNDNRLPDDEELAMSALPPPRAPVPAWAMAQAAALLTMGAAWQVSRRLNPTFQGARARAGRGGGPLSPSAARSSRARRWP